MDLILDKKIRFREALNYSSLNKMNSLSTIDSIYIFNSLSIKKIMVEPVIHYIRSPLAESIEIALHFTYYFPFISANAISYFHCIVLMVLFFVLIKRYKSYYGNFGYYVDTFSDIIGGICLILGCLFYFYKQRSLRSSSSRTNVFFKKNLSTNDTNNEETNVIISNLEDDQKSLGIHLPVTTNLDNNLLEINNIL